MLHALAKADGGVRPIAVGMTLCRLVSKAANVWAIHQGAHLLSPCQLGAGAKGGAATHAFISSAHDNQAVVKIDFTNAFNSLRRDSMLEAVVTHLPELFLFVALAYGNPSCLTFGPYSISSEEGIQQGDPLGPLLFCITLIDVLAPSKCLILCGLPGRITLGDSVDSLITEAHDLKIRAHSVGLTLNESKCEVIGLSATSHQVWTSSGRQIPECAPEKAVLLGSPFYDVGVTAALELQRASLVRATNRLQFMSSHEALYLLKSSLAMPRLLHLLRSTDCAASTKSFKFDMDLRNALSAISNTSLEDTAWSQAVLPVRWGGLGLRSIATLASSALLASSSAVRGLVHSVLPPGYGRTFEQNVANILLRWQGLGGGNEPMAPLIVQSEALGRPNLFGPVGRIAGGY